MAYVVSQIIGGIVSLLIFASMQTKKITRVMLCLVGCNALGTLSYVLLGGFSGCGIYLVATVQSVIFYFIRKYEKKEPMWLNVVIFIAYIVCTVITFESLIDLVPMLAAIFCALGILQKKPTNYRLSMLLNGTTWIFYDIFVAAYTMLASHAITVGSAIVGIVRLDILKKSEKD